MTSSDSGGARVRTRTGALRTIVAGARAHPRPAALAATAGVINGATMVVGAAAVGWATDHLVVPVLDGRRVAGHVWWLSAAAIVGVSAVRSSSLFVRGIATGHVQYGAQADSRRAITDRYLRLDLGWHRRHPAGRLLAHAVADVDAQWTPMQYAFFAFGMVVMLAITLVDLSLHGVALAAIAVVLVAAVLGLNLLYQRLLVSRTREAQAARAEIGRVAHESIEGGAVIRSLGLGTEEAARFAPGVERLRRANAGLARIASVFDPLLELLPTAAVLAVLAAGAPRVAAGRLTVGDLVGIVYLLLTVSIPLSIISRFLSMLPTSTAGRERVDAVLASRELDTRGEHRLTDPHDVYVVARGAGLVRDGTTLVRGLDVRLEAGTVTAVVGTTGAGKTSALDLLSGQSRATEGVVELNGRPIHDLADGEVADVVAVVSQSPFLFADTIRENLTLGRTHHERELWEALRVAAVDDVVRALPLGLDTPVGERGTTLSGGQRQRLCLARAVLRRPRVLVLDDATSALDPAVERIVVANLAVLALEERLALVVVANRPAAASLATHVLLLEGGSVTAAGTHHELLELEGYRRIVTAYDQPTADLYEEPA